MVPGVTSGDRGNWGWKLLRVTEPCSILWRKLRKDWCRDVELSGNGSVHEFYCMKSLITFEQVNASVKTSIWWWGYKLVGRCKLSLYENESCDEHAVYFRAMIEITGHIHHVTTFWQWFVFVHAYSIIVEYDVRSKYSEEYSTVHKVGSEKLLAKKSCFA